MCTKLYLQRYLSSGCDSVSNKNLGLTLSILIAGTGISECTSGSGKTGTGIFISFSGSSKPEFSYQTRTFL